MINFRELIVSFLKEIYWQIRPMVDFSIALISLIIASPVFLVIGMIIKISSSGSVFYTQVRVGKNGQYFNIIKFRTMNTDAESKTGPVWASKADTRITGFGRFLRKTHMDELPQLINVLIGDMSVIGPRPERPHFIDMLNKEILGYKRRLSVKPGITGLAQCCHKYDETIRDVRRKLRYDVLYIEKMSLMLDLKILWRTLSVSFLNVKT
ncbi:MAG: sugar transferase [Planctomycetota bacterium]|jgi:lipopolysaccharide/colanic/teichoic acid biosynthesis glycosyltransferase